MSELERSMHALGLALRQTAATLTTLPATVRTDALYAMADAVENHRAAILAANTIDMAEAASLPDALRDRLLLTDARMTSIVEGIRAIARQPDPVGRTLQAWDVAHNGLHIAKVSVPLGVIGMIYESRPNVTADAAALCIRSGNACLLRPGSESMRSSRAILEAIHEGLQRTPIPKEAVALVPSVDRAAVTHMLGMRETLDILIPRGGKSLTERVLKESRVPTILHLEGNCHTYIHRKADPQKALAITANAKLRRTGVCGATESLLIDRELLHSTGNAVATHLLNQGCEVRGDTEIQALDARIKPAREEDWATEYLAPILSVRSVDGIEQAIAHIARYGSHHTDAIITEDEHAAALFLERVDSAIVLHNASTQFADGGEFGFGGEIGISTGRLHARGPVGAAQLVTYKYRITTQNPKGAVRA